ncbi:MAG: hypothetical protein ACRC14_01815, partial [Paracoccaceae bacterium]
RDTFIERFVAYMVRTAGPNFDDGESVEDYARDVAESYWADSARRDEGPEECADADMSYWGED